MERRRLQPHEAFLEIYGNPAEVLAVLPATVTAQIVAPDTLNACVIPDISPGGRKNLAHLSVGGRRVVISGCAPAVAFLLSQFSAVSVTDFSPRPTESTLTVYFLTTPAVASVARKVTCLSPRPGVPRRGVQPSLFA